MRSAKPAGSHGVSRAQAGPQPEPKPQPRPEGVRRATASAEHDRLSAPQDRPAWLRWGPYLSDRQWGTVREDYSPQGDCWSSFPHDHARSRAYRWGEDGIMGLCDEQCRLCFALAFWNGHDPILKERLFGLTGPEGNHGEDVKEEYFYLEATPTGSYLRAAYVYPIQVYPYEQLVGENRARRRDQREFELADTGVLAEGVWDVQKVYAKASPNDILICVTIRNRSAAAATLHALPTLWFRNTWSWGPAADGSPAEPMPRLSAKGLNTIAVRHPTLGDRELCIDSASDGTTPELLFTDNQTNARRLWGAPNASAYVKDVFHERVIRGDTAAVNPDHEGTKAAAWFQLTVPAGGEVVLRLRLRPLDGAAASDAQGGRGAGGLGRGGTPRISEKSRARRARCLRLGVRPDGRSAQAGGRRIL